MRQLEPTTEKRPLVAVTMNWDHCADWVVRGGGEVRLLTPGGNPALDQVSGLLLTGGEDVDPTLYGESNRNCKRVNPERDRFELTLLEAALNRGIPILAVCRGMQLLSVAFGGKLYQDLSERLSDISDADRLSHRGPGGTDTTHPVDIEPLSALEKCVRKSTLLVNSHHHQGVRILPRSLRISCRSRDGLAEAVEQNNNSWILGLQWHPERWPDPASSSIMANFLGACCR